LPGKLAFFAVPLIVTLAHATVARASDEEAPPEAAAPAPDETANDGEAAPRARLEPYYPPPLPRPEGYYPPPVDGPALRLPESATRIYLDGAYAESDDLTALPYIAGKGRNVRVALGGALRWRRLTFDAQLPFHVTNINVTSVLNQAPKPEDKVQTKPSLGDLTMGVVATGRLTDGEGLIAGIGVRGRFPTHTTRFQFHLNDGSVADFVIPYYFHVEPTAIVGGALGPLTYVMNQGAIILLGPDANFDTEHITVPTIYFYEAHYALGLAPHPMLGVSVELATLFQLNHVAGVDFEKFNDIRAIWVAPALQFHPSPGIRIDAIARLGLSRGQELYGVLEYVGTHSFTLRLTRAFN
jgi:hypothetical protein